VGGGADAKLAALGAENDAGGGGVVDDGNGGAAGLGACVGAGNEECAPDGGADAAVGALPAACPIGGEAGGGTVPGAAAGVAANAAEGLPGMDEPGTGLPSGIIVGGGDVKRLDEGGVDATGVVNGTPGESVTGIS
jgi:hypothetical protein